MEKGQLIILIESYSRFLWIEKGQLIILIESYNSFCE